MDGFDYEDDFFFEEDKMGMSLTSGSVTLEKDEKNLIGISIGGGAKYCPCLYVVQIFDNTCAAKDGVLQSGDEIIGVNKSRVKGKSKQEVAQIIQKSEGSVTLHYRKLHADPKQGKTLDIALKKMKHRIVEGISSSTADALGMSRAILCNDSLVKKMQELERTETTYRSLLEHTKRLLKAFFELTKIYKRFGGIFCEIGVREQQQTANEAFTEFGEAHRQMEKYGIAMLKRLKPILSDLSTYLNKAIPDTKLTVSRYADAKFEYLSYCLKVKEMDDEEIQFAHMQEPLYRVETGNYEYRLILRCRQEARIAFAKLRSDVLVKLELLDSKRVDHLTDQLSHLIKGLSVYHHQCAELIHDKHWFPIELDLKGAAFETNDDFTDDDLIDAIDEGEDVAKSSTNMGFDAFFMNATPYKDEPDTPAEEITPKSKDIDLLGDF